MRSRNILLLLCGWMLLLPAFAFAGTGDTLASSPFGLAQSDRTLFPEASLRMKTQREVRNYIRPCVSLSFFSTGSRPIKGNQDILNERLGDYSFLQTSVSFYTPLYTHTRFAGADSTEVKTFHLLFTLNALTDRPTFSGLEKQHELYKFGIGIRGIWAFNSRCILFADVSPLVTGDHYNEQATRRLRMGSTFVMNMMVKPKFSFRVGVTKNFLFGNKYFLPMLGFRIGKLDGKCYFQMQFPRHTSLTFQPSPKVSINLYSRFYGGLYNVSNGDSLYVGRDSVIQFGHFGVANGIRFDYRPGPNFSMFISTGVSARNHLWFYSYSFNQQHDLAPLTPFYKGAPDKTLFINVGISVRFGKSKRSIGNYLMYDVFDLNNTMDPGDNNNNPGNGDIRKSADAKEMKNVQYKDVEDLVDETDLY
jgi:hypothetical protein